MNDENLKGYGFHERTASEQRELAVMGGKASGKVRRRKADFRRTLNMLLTAEIDNNEYKPILEALGVESTLESAMLMSMIKAALGGNVKAAYFVAQYAGQSSQTAADDEEQQIRTDRARKAREQEVGDIGNSDENIQSFLKALRPTQEELNELFSDESFEEEDVNDAEETEETGEV